MTLTKNDLKRLRRRLPRGYTTLVVNHLAVKGTAVSPQLVTMVMGGHRSNLEVLQAIVEVAEEHEKTVLHLSRRVRTRLTA